MGSRTIKFCDLDEKHDADTNILFSVNGEAFTLDLCKLDSDKFEKALAPFIKAATAMDLKEMTKKLGGNGHSEVDLTDVRAWAAKNGIEVAAKGRVAADVVEKYQAAHPSK